ncbi:hypothetical protein CI102_7486 [Trichoderma harzianum]|nr:hypothetical protein CI102_7486 [Trichoderma harzianum]
MKPLFASILPPSTASIYGVSSPFLWALFLLFFFFFKIFFIMLTTSFCLRHDILLRTAARAQGLPIFIRSCHESS